MPLEPVEPEYFGEVASRYRYIGSNTEIGLVSSVTQAIVGGIFVFKIGGRQAPQEASEKN